MLKKLTEVRKLTPEEITQVYEELGQMLVPLDPDANRGLQYVKERLTTCRAMLDRLGELRLQCSQAHRAVASDLLAVRLKYRLTPSDVVLQQMDLVKGEREDHQLLLSVIRSHAAMLASTRVDIGKLADMTKEQIKLGEIDPKDAPGLVQPVAIEELAASMPSPSVTLGPPSDIIEGIQDVQAPAEEGSDPPVDFEDLFGVLNGKPGSRLN
jgi:hypothetical protein